LCLISLLLIAGCASTKDTSRERLATGDVARPDRIWVDNFVTTPADVPADSTFARQFSEPSAPQTDEEIASGRKLGNEIALNLVNRMTAQGLPVALGSTLRRPQINDILIRGYLLSIDKGSAVKRFVFGYGAGEVKAAVETFQMTAQGLRKLGSGTLESSGTSTVQGRAEKIANEIADHLNERFHEQGWVFPARR
jgi:hypothetical protein